MSRLDGLLAIVVLALIPALGIYLQKPPDAVSSSASATEFSAERAMVHVRKIAQHPHPKNTEESAKVREYLVEQLKELGITPEFITSPGYPGTSIVGVLPGTVGAEKGLMLSAHYDSRAEGPGAGDDAAGVAAILEAVRAVKAGPPLGNDLIVLFTDDEEYGMSGARAFVESFRRRQRVGLILNFEARGSRGPSYMFETSARNGWMVRQLALAAPYPFATSLTAAVYRQMPNNTDLSVFKGMALKGMNFAFVDGYENYHQPSDTPENLDPRSLQHHGSYALSLARRFGGLDLNRADLEPDVIYFYLMGPHLILYPESFATPLMIASLVIFGIVMMLGLRTKRITERGVMQGLVLGITAFFVSVMVPYATWLIIARGRPVGVKGQGTPEIAVGLTFLGLALVLLLYGIFARKIARTDLATGGLFWWLAMTVYTTYTLPGASYVFVWPTLFGLVGMAVRVLVKDDSSRLANAVDYVAVLPVLLILPPTMQALCAGLGPSDPFIVAPVAALLVIAVLPMLAKLQGILPPATVKPSSPPH